MSRLSLVNDDAGLVSLGRAVVFVTVLLVALLLVDDVLLLFVLLLLPLPPLGLSLDCACCCLHLARRFLNQTCKEKNDFPQ